MKGKKEDRSERQIEIEIEIEIEKLLELNYTRKVPWIEFIEIDLSNDGNGNRLRCASPAEIVHNKLLVGWMKAETGGKLSQVGCHFSVWFSEN